LAQGYQCFIVVAIAARVVLVAYSTTLFEPAKNDKHDMFTEKTKGRTRKRRKLKQRRKNKKTEEQIDVVTNGAQDGHNHRRHMQLLFTMHVALNKKLLMMILVLKMSNILTMKIVVAVGMA
jgi:hypothetical protein